MQNCHPMVRMSMDMAQGASASGSSGASTVAEEASAQTGTLRYSALPLELRGNVQCDAKSGLRAKLATRFLILEHSVLHVFERELTAKDRALVPMFSIDMDTVTVDVGSREFEIVLALPDGKHFSFLVSDQDSLERWFYCLKRARNRVDEFYEVGREIGKGTFGSVLIARDRLTGELCVVKLMTKNQRSRRQLALLEREMVILKQTNNHYVVQAYDIFNSPTEVCIVMELMRGGELYDLLASSSGLTEDIACHIANQLLEGIAHLHALNIVHRDVKPENVLLESRETPPTVKLTDFGLSNLLDSGLVQENLLNSVVGSLLYVAPELLAGGGYGCSVDIWAVGVIVFAMLSGELPFNIEDKQDYERFLRRGPAFKEELWRGVSNVAKWFVRALLQVDPNKRLTARGALQHVWIQANPHAHLIVTDIKYTRTNRRRRHSRLLDKLRATVLVIDTLRFLLKLLAVSSAKNKASSVISASIPDGPHPHNVVQHIQAQLITDAANESQQRMDEPPPVQQSSTQSQFR